MTNWRYKQLLKLVKDFENVEEELWKAIEEILWRMHQICAERGLMKKLSRKERSKLHFEFRNGFGSEMDKNSILLTGLHHNYGELIYVVVQQEDGLPASWLWKKTWEAEFIKQWVKPWQDEMIIDDN